MFEKFDDTARRIIFNAKEEARILRHPLVGTSHLLLALTAERDTDTAVLLSREGVTYDGVCFRLIEMAGLQIAQPPGKVIHTDEFRPVVSDSRREADEYGAIAITPATVLSAMMAQKMGIARGILRSLDVDLDALHPRVRASYQRA